MSHFHILTLLFLGITASIANVYVTEENGQRFTPEEYEIKENNSPGVYHSKDFDDEEEEILERQKEHAHKDTLRDVINNQLAQPHNSRTHS
jgi:hypothetical protein